MFELSGKLAKSAFDGAANKSSGTKPSKEKAPGTEFSSIMDKVQGKEVSEVVKVLSNEIDLRPQKEITAIQSQSIENVELKNEETTKTNAMEKISGIMGEVNDGQVKLQRLIDLVTSGQKLSPQELIAIQAGVFSLVQEMELVGKVTQEATQGVRQTLNTNLG